MSNAEPTLRQPPKAAARAGHTQFFRNYNRTIGTAYGLLLLGLASFFGYQLQQNLQAEISFVEARIERHGQFLEFALRTATDQLETLRMAAAAQQANARCAEAGRQRADEALRQIGPGYNRDAAPDRDAGGNLVGEGSLLGRSADFYCDLGAALGLDAHLHAMAFHLPHAARARFLSVQGFHLESPWRPARTMPFDRHLFEGEIWQLGQAPANPDRLKYWAAPYFGGQDVGLLAPVAAPVHAGNRLMGVVAIEMSLDYLNRVNGGFDYPLGRVAIIDAQGRVLAHPDLYADPLAVQAPARLEQAIAPALLASPAQVAALPQGRATAIAGSVLVRRGFISAPWQLVYSVPLAALWEKLLLERGASMAAVLVSLGLLMAVTYWITAREFVGPAAKLVGHVQAESNFQPQPLPRVPAGWRPWFEAITRAFRESLQLSSLRNELDIAARMQQSILPRQWPQDARYRLAGTMQAARDVGGDFYDHFPLSQGRCGLVVADVSGKGISAGLFGMVCKTLLRSVATQGELAPGAVARRVNDALCAQNDASMFVTAFYASYDPGSGRLAYVNAGHPPPLLLRPGAPPQWLPFTAGTAFGVLEELDYQEAVTDLQPGDTLLVFTDGVTEAIDIDGREFGKDRLQALFAGRTDIAPGEAVQGVLGAVGAFARGVEQFDDITCLALHCQRLGVPA